MEIIYQTLLDAAERAGLDEEALSPRYSGRGMFGRECVGLTYEYDGELFDFLSALRDLGVDIKAMKDPTHDGMGRRTIAYWRNVTASEVPEGVF
jgi:hypothetical protein